MTNKSKKKVTKRSQNQINYSQISEKIVYGTFIILSLGTFYSFQQFIQLKLPNLRSLPREEQNTHLFGSDYAAYQYLQNTPRDAKILFLAPDAFYIAKSTLFLYPRTVVIIGNPQDIYNQKLADYDAIFIYISTREFAGYISGLSMNQIVHEWSLETLYEVDNFIKDYWGNESEKSDSLEEFVSKLSNQGGNLLYQPK